MSTELRKYFKTTAKLWAGLIAGPILAIITIASVVASAWVDTGSRWVPLLAKASAWLTGVATIVLMFRAQYDAWRETDYRLAVELEKNKEAPRMDVAVLNVVPHGSLGDGITDLFFNVSLILEKPSEVVVRDFSLEIFNQATSLTSHAVDDVDSWELVQMSGSYTRTPCVPLTKELNRRGDPVQGWVHFRLDNLRESAVELCTLRFKANCVHGTCYYNVSGVNVHPDANAKGTMRRKHKQRN